MAITSTPAFPLPGQAVRIGLSVPAGNTIRGGLTAVPSGSALEVGLLVDPATGLPVDTFTPDVAGVYGVEAHDYRHVVAFGGRDDYLNTVAGSVYVATWMDLSIRTQSGHGATLRLTIAGAVVGGAALVLPLSELSRVAALDAAVVAALAALVGVATTALDAEFVADVRVLRAAFEAHRILTTGSPEVHVSADVTNVMRRETPTAMAAAIATLNDLYDQMVAHTTAGALGGVWHHNDDGINVPVVGKATDLGSAVVLKADLRERVFERHRVQVGATVFQVHGSADTTNIIAAPLPLPVLIVAYLDAIALALPTAPTGEGQGAVTLAHNLGFRAN